MSCGTHAQASELFEILCSAECLIQLCKLLLHPLFSQDQNHAALALQPCHDVAWQAIDKALILHRIFPGSVQAYAAV